MQGGVGTRGYQVPPLEAAQQAQLKVSAKCVQKIGMKITYKEKDGVGIPATLLRLKILYSVAQSGSLRLLKRRCKCITNTMPSPYTDEYGTLFLIRYVIDPALSTTH